MAFAQKFYTSDTHFGHGLMISERVQCQRPFKTTLEMDEFMIAAWNAVVRPDDLVYHLGDFSFGLHDGNRVRSIFNRLNGRKILILGNHDYGRQNIVHPVIESLAWDQPPAQMIETTDEGQRLVLCHYALRTWPGIAKGSWHFFGHNHGSMPPLGRSRDVGVDCPGTGYGPRTFKQLVAGMKDAAVPAPGDVL